MGKNIYTSSWDEWQEFCQHYDENPHEICELGFDEGLGNSTTVYYTGDYPEKDKDE